jgi:hypothetical protein
MLNYVTADALLLLAIWSMREFFLLSYGPLASYSSFPGFSLFIFAVVPSLFERSRILFKLEALFNNFWFLIY